jgi:GNAT superfamily N-acetyltransferase
MRLFGRKRPLTPRGAAEIRRAGPDELEPIVELLAGLVAAQVPRRKRARYLDAVREEQRRRLDDPDTVWFVANRGADLVGCARVDIRREHPLLAYLDKSEFGYLFGVFVTAPERGRGTGAKLVAACEAWLRTRGIRWAILHSAPDAIGFYEAEGYEPSLEFAKKL